MKTNTTDEAAFEDRLRKALRKQPQAHLSPGFAARVKMAATSAPAAAFMPAQPVFSPSRAQMFLASLLFIASFASGSLYSSNTAATTQASNDPLLFSLYYSSGSLL